MTSSELIFQAVQYMVDHIKIKLEQTGSNIIKAKLLIRTDDGIESIISEDSITYNPKVNNNKK
jgi:hypothetical protein